MREEVVTEVQIPVLQMLDEIFDGKLCVEAAKSGIAQLLEGGITKQSPI